MNTEENVSTPIAPLPASYAPDPNVDQRLTPLFEATSVALRERRRLVVLGMWKLTHAISLLPFHGYLGRAPFHEFLPLHPQLGIVSFHPEDERALCEPTYDTIAALKFRRQDRIRRSILRSSESLTLADWERAVTRRPNRFKNLMLPASSFVQIINAVSGCRWRRPILGWASRVGPKPTCLFHGRGDLTPEVIKAFSEVDFLVVNLQGLRSASRFESLSRILECRGKSKPTVIVAAGPSDLLPLWEANIFEDKEFWAIGAPIPLPNTHVKLVGRERLQAEREFEFAFRDLKPDDPNDAKLLSLAKSAWWASHQQLRTGHETPEMKRFEATFHNIEAADPAKADMLRFGKQLLQRQQTTNTQSERRQAVVDVSLSAEGGSGLLIITRNWHASDDLRADLASEGWNQEALQTLGVTIRPPSWSIERRADTAVTAGFFGPQTIDCLLSSRAKHLYFVLDPVEVRAMWFALGRFLEILKQAHCDEAYSALLSIRDAICRHVPAFASELEMKLDFHETFHSRNYNPVLDPVQYGHVAILLADGTRLDVLENTRFEVVNSSVLTLQTARASDLHPGDEIIVLDNESRAQFSDRLLAVIDDGPLSSAAEARQAWFEIVKAVRLERPIPIASVTQQMKKMGHCVTAFNIRTWLPSIDVPYPSTPDSLDKFLGLADALQIALSRDCLSDLYGGIRQWRNGHRKCGRYLARAIRGAYSGRLDAATLGRIERDWGMTARQLMQAAVVATVENVLKPEVVTSATH